MYKLTATFDGQHGAGKHKVFTVACAPAPGTTGGEVGTGGTTPGGSTDTTGTTGTTTTGTTGTTTTTTTTTTETGSTGGGTAEPGAEGATTSGGSVVTPAGGGLGGSGGTVFAQSVGGGVEELPYTGMPITTLIVLTGGSTAAGVSLLRRGRRRPALA